MSELVLTTDRPMSESADVEQPIVFKKRKVSQAVRRKTEQDSENQGDEADADVLKALEEVRDQQKSRVRSSGVDLIGDAEEIEQEVNKQTDTTKSLGAHFQQAEHKTEVNSHMQKFIQDQLAVRHGKAVDDVKKPDEQKETKELFHLPDFLNEPKNNPKSNDMPVTDGWLVGIAEVNLSIDYKMKNIERTEAERQRRSQNTNVQESFVLPSNMGVNFQQHRREFAMEKAPKPQGDEPRAPQASDQRSVQQFIKRNGFK